MNQNAPAWAREWHRWARQTARKIRACLKSKSGRAFVELCTLAARAAELLEKPPKPNSPAPYRLGRGPAPKGANRLGMRSTSSDGVEEAAPHKPRAGRSAKSENGGPESARRRRTRTPAPSLSPENAQPEIDGTQCDPPEGVPQEGLECRTCGKRFWPSVQGVMVCAGCLHLANAARAPARPRPNNRVADVDEQVAGEVEERGDASTPGVVPVSIAEQAAGG